MKNKILKERGITLVALVVTVVVLLILSGITIAVLTGPNGIITKARQAKIAQQNAQVHDKLEMIRGQVEIDNAGRATWENYEKELIKEGIITGDENV